MKTGIAKLLLTGGAFVVAGLLGSAPAAAAPTCTSINNLGMSGSGIVSASSLTAGSCVLAQDKLYGNFNLGNLPSDTVLIFNLNMVGSLDHHQLSFDGTYNTGTTYNFGYAVSVYSNATPGTVITSLDADFTQTAGGPSTLTKDSSPVGSGAISETKIGPVLQLGSVTMTTFGAGITDLTISESLVDNGTISSVTNTVTEFVPGRNIPEPASLALLGAGLAGLGALRRKRAAKK